MPTRWPLTFNWFHKNDLFTNLRRIRDSHAKALQSARFNLAWYDDKDDLPAYGYTTIVTFPLVSSPRSLKSFVSCHKWYTLEYLYQKAKAYIDGRCVDANRDFLKGPRSGLLEATRSGTSSVEAGKSSLPERDWQCRVQKRPGICR